MFPDSAKISRRHFLKHAAGALGSVGIIPSTSLGNLQRAAPSERLNLAVIGVKKMGGAHVESLLGFGEVQLVAVCDVDSKAREAAKKKIETYYAGKKRDGQYNGCETYNEYEMVLARPDIDAVVIAVPDHWHAIIAIDACRAGKDVYCEKPLSLTIREARAMVNAARRYGRVFQTGTQQRSEANFRHACELVRNGYIGELKTVHVEVGRASRYMEFPEEPIPAGFDYERWLGPAPYAPYNKLRVGSNYWDGWRRFRDYSGGKMTDWGAHHFDIAQWGLGMDESGPVEIIPPPARDGTIYEEAKLPQEGAGASPADPSWGLRHRYANGVEIIKDGTNGIRFVGTEGWIEANRGQPSKAWPESLVKQKIGPNEIRLYESKNHHQNWFDCIRTRRRPAADVEIGCRSVTVCHLGNIALWLNRPIRWDAAREEIIGDEAAARWLDRPKRAPYRLYI